MEIKYYPCSYLEFIQKEREARDILTRAQELARGVNKNKNFKIAPRKKKIQKERLVEPTRNNQRARK